MWTCKWSILTTFILVITLQLVWTEDLTDKIINLLVEQAEKIPLEEFKEDIVLLQKVDRINSITSYLSPFKVSEPLYVHGGVDVNKSTIVLHPGKSSKHEKRRFVILRRSIENAREYHAAFAYVRNACKNDDQKLAIEGKEFSIEFAQFDNRDDDKDMLKNLGWQECRGTIFVPCWSNDTDAIKRDFISASQFSDTKTLTLSTSESKSVDTTGNRASSSFKIISAGPDGGETDWTYEFYGDLEDDAVKARYAGESVKYTIKGKIISSHLSGKIELDIVKDIKTGKVNLADLSPDLLKAIMAKYGKEQVGKGKETFQELYNKLNFTKTTQGNEQFLDTDTIYMVQEILDGDNGTDLLHEKEIIVDGPTTPTPKPGQTTAAPAPAPTQSPNGPTIVTIVNNYITNNNNNINNDNHAVTNNNNINNNNINNNVNINSGSVNSGIYGPPPGYGMGDNNHDGTPTKPPKWWTIKPTKKPPAAKPSPPSSPPSSSPPASPPAGTEMSQAEKDKLYAEFLIRLKEEAIKNCPPGKKCRVVETTKPTVPSKTDFGGGNTFVNNPNQPNRPGYPAHYGAGYGYPVGYVAPVTYIVARPPPNDCRNNFIHICASVGIGNGFLGLGVSLGVGPVRLGRTLGPAGLLSDVAGYLSHPGWKPLNSVGTTNISLDYENVPYLGFGYCLPKVQTPDNLIAIKNEEEAVAFYMDILRLGCIRTEFPYFQVLYNRHCLALNPDKSFSVPSTCPYIQKKKLTGVEFRELSRAFELSVLSQQIVAELTHPDATNLTPDGKHISRTVHTLGKFVLSALVQYVHEAPHHYVKLTRNLVVTLKTAFTKSLEDWTELAGRCEPKECSVDKSVNENDRLYLLSLSEFIIRGVGPRDSAEVVKSAFVHFYKINHEAIQSRLSDYN